MNVIPVLHKEPVGRGCTKMNKETDLQQRADIEPVVLTGVLDIFYKAMRGHHGLSGGLGQRC